ncbi:permease prefix domain 1-containing protein [Xylanimonas ulmi]|uniref:Uncharacterized protein n=1 Tax=Xylanimonas ulmi TaxID=228973 RepID=A0A4Q7M3A6_9MICO|nr:permease prefix domain 1-containing protein [Xylanibacterium ulmi]RZS60419.1 hypothetical protein EV386_0676 [Xylanibacterium ulmi]
MTTVHRLLDEAFAGVPQSPEVADLKEEMRAGLLDRAAELEASGLSADDAARRAVAELGDVGALVAEVSGASAGRRGAADPAPDTAPDPVADEGSPAWAVAERLRALHHVRPRPSFVVSVTLAALVAAGAVAALALVLAGVLALTGTAATFGLSALAAIAAGWIVGSSLRQETTRNHPVPAGRAAGYGTATALAVAGGGVVTTSLLDADLDAGAAWPLGGAVLLVLGALALTWLGVTQTNRTKAWAREAARAHHGDDRFSQDPAAAARFGMYTAVIWVMAFVVTAVLGVVWTWRWSWLTLVAAWAVTMLLLAQMLFGKDTQR